MKLRSRAAVSLSSRLPSHPSAAASEFRAKRLTESLVDKLEYGGDQPAYCGRRNVARCRSAVRVARAGAGAPGAPLRWRRPPASRTAGCAASPARVQLRADPLAWVRARGVARFSPGVSGFALQTALDTYGGAGRSSRSAAVQGRIQRVGYWCHTCRSGRPLRRQFSGRPPAGIEWSVFGQTQTTGDHRPRQESRPGGSGCSGRTHGCTRRFRFGLLEAARAAVEAQGWSYEAVFPQASSTSHGTRPSALIERDFSLKRGRSDYSAG